MASSDFTTKKCSMCGQEFPATEIHFRLRKDRNQLYSRCRRCEHQIDADRRQQHPEKYQASQLKFRKNNPDRSREIKREWELRNKDRVVAKSANRYKQKRDSIRRQQREYEKNNPEKKRIRSQRRRTSVRSADGVYSDKDIRILYETQNARCGYCGILIYWGVSRDIHIDHIHPLSKGGSNWPNNFILTCESCNLGKGSKTFDEWKKARGW